MYFTKRCGLERTHINFTTLVGTDIPIPIRRGIIHIPIHQSCITSIIPIATQQGDIFLFV